MNATHLLIPGYLPPQTGHTCCICGDGAGDLIGRDFFGDTFRDYREMPARLSPYICDACALSLKDVPSGVVTYLDGSKKYPKSAARGLGWRFFSWFLVEGKEPIAATKAHCKEIREILAAPPVGVHFAVIIADSGQKQLIYRLQAQKVLHPGDPFDIQFETERVRIDGEFFELLGIADQMAAVVGKTRILEPESYLTLYMLIDAYGDTIADKYFFFMSRVDTPVARLCGFLAKSKEKTDGK